MPYTFSLLNTKSETRFDGEIIEDVMEYVKDNSDSDTVVLVEKNLMDYLYYPLLGMDYVKVYPIEPGYFESFCVSTGFCKSKVIYITDDMGNDYVSKGTLKYLKYNIPKITEEEDISTVLGLPTGFSDGESDKIQIVESDALHKMLDGYMFKEMELEDLNLSINKIEITDEGLAHIIVSLTDHNEIFRNDKLLLSYHLEYENAEDEYEQPRILFGPLSVEDYLIDVDLSNQPEDVTVVIDVVEDGVAWYSYEHKVPIILFNETDQGWNYKIYNFFTKSY